MKFLLFLLYPFSFLYKCIILVRHFLYDKGWIESKKYSLPIICVGNLSVGGTGKTPMTEYLIQFLKNDYKVAVLSRGYKRKTKGFVLANEQSNAQTIGDEPFTYYRKNSEILTAVCENRANGINTLLQEKPQPQIIILDDAFQHRKVQSGFSILLTTYNNLYYNDFLLPMGSLRDVKSRAQKANCIIVSKCPETISETEKKHINLKINPLSNQHIFYTGIKYADFVQSQREKISLTDWVKTPFCLITGIANPKPLIDFLKSKMADFETLTFADHHHFSQAEIKALSSKQRILTTEKDFVRLYTSLENIFYLPIETYFISKSEELSFRKEILHFVSQYK